MGLDRVGGKIQVKSTLYVPRRAPGKAEEASANKEFVLTSDPLHRRLALPVRCYKIRMQHRLLSQLGPFSHLVLDAADQFGPRAGPWVEKLTGLSAAQLAPITDRLKELRLQDNDGNLTESGQHLAMARKRLHDRAGRLWLDSEYGRQTFVGDESLEVAPLEATDRNLLLRDRRTSPSQPWPIQSVREDCARQRQRVLNFSSRYLPLAFEHGTDCLDPNGRLMAEWDLDVQLAHESRMTYALRIGSVTPRVSGSTQHDFTLASPVFCVYTTHRLPDWLTDSSVASLPAPIITTAAFMPSNGHVGELESPPEGPQWPSPGPTTGARARRVLAQGLTDACKSEHAMFDRQHRFEERWLQVGMDWADLVPAIEATPGAHWIGDRAS